MRRRLSLIPGLTIALGVLLAGRSAGETPRQGLQEFPLEPAKGADAKTLFTRVDPAESGLWAENRYADPRMRGELYREFDTSSVGTGVALGDFDGDGRTDVFVVNKSDSCRLFRNLGGWRFEDVTRRAGVEEVGGAESVWKQGACFADVNNDGWLDLYVCRFDAPNLLYINQGDGTFREEAAKRGLALKDSSVMAAFSDYDRDGWLDVYVTTNLLSVEAAPGGQRGYLCRNRGSGFFEDVTLAAGTVAEGQSHSASWWDQDEDGWPDLYVAFDYGVPDKLFRNQRNGSFRDVLASVAPSAAFSSMGADSGDVNNDGRVDFLVADMAPTNTVADQRFVADTRARTEERAPGDPTVPMVHRNVLYVNSGANRLIEAGFLAGVAATDWTWSVRFEDLDNDGYVDLFATNGFHQTPSVDLIRRMTNATSLAERKAILQGSPVQSEANIAFRNRGELAFENVSSEWGLDESGVSFGNALGDLDGDGDLDMIYTNYRAGPTTLRNNDTRGKRVTVALRGVASNRFGVDARVEIKSSLGQQVRVISVARGYLSSSEPAAHFGFGDDEMIEQLTVHWSSGRVQTFSKLATNRRYVITEPSGDQPAKVDRTSDRGRVFREAASEVGLDRVGPAEKALERGRPALYPLRLEAGGRGLAVGALRPGGPVAVVQAGAAGEPWRAFVQTVDGRFEERGRVGEVEQGHAADGPILLGDLSGDGKADLLVSKAGDDPALPPAEYRARVYWGDGDGAWGAAGSKVLPESGVSVGALAASDVDGDGAMDLFVGARNVPGNYLATPSSALWMNRGGKWEDTTEVNVPGLLEVGRVTAALWADLDADGRSDLVVATDWGRVRCFRNSGGGRMEEWTERLGFAAAGEGWWRSLSAADFNGDGRSDVAVGNVGLNTEYSMEPARPARLFWLEAKMSSSSIRAAVEAKEEAGQLWPRRTRRELGAVFPALLRKFTTNAAFARATLPQLLGEENLKRATTWTASEWRSGVFLSQPDGLFRFHALPRVAQVAPATALAAADFDRDGAVDLYVVHNTRAPIPAVGAFDGGLSLWLRGDGKGGFEAVGPAESGLVVPGAASAIAVADFNTDGAPDLLVRRVGDRALVFLNEGVDRTVGEGERTNDQ